MINPVTQDLARRAKIDLLQWRIESAHARLRKCKSCTSESRKRMLKLMVLIQRRNSLLTPDDVLAIEKQRGLA